MHRLSWLALALVLAGCGASATAATPRPEVERTVAEALELVAEPVAALEGVSDVDELVERLEEGEEAAHAAASLLEALDPPEELDQEVTAMVAALEVLAEDFHRVAETLTRLQEEGIEEWPALLEALGSISFEGVELVKDALLALHQEGVEPGGPLLANE